MTKVVPITQDLLREVADGRDPNFELFWSSFPRKRAKLDAYKAWQQTARLRPSIELVLASIQDKIQSGEWNDVQYIPWPASWLRAGCWMDED